MLDARAGSCTVICLLAVLVLTGCGGDPLVRIDTSEAEFSTPDDYAAYDREMAELSQGQEE